MDNKWEYKTVFDVNRHAIENYLAEVGRVGWELATITQMNNQYILVLKRPLTPVKIAKNIAMDIDNM